MGGSRKCSGRLEVKHEDEWFPLNPSGLEKKLYWEQKLSTVACRQLGCGAPVSTKFISVSDYTPTWRLGVKHCAGSESLLRECGSFDDWNADNILELTCSGNKQ